MLVRIDKDIHNIQEAIADVVSRIDALHLKYAQAIAKAAHQQILLAAFSFCTQKCPQEFLTLTLTERQNFQEELQKTIKALIEQIQKTLEECDRDNRTNQENLDSLLSKSLDESMEKLNKLLVEHKILSADAANKDNKASKMSIRLAEIEFTDRQVMSSRGELRVLSARLNHLHNELEKKYQLKTIAEAELAWRSAWVES
ncbi:hypothetical protein [Pseudanabaena sp. FACHB-1998]|uniref:hypothetical protein n=1 Tax=Pseudanabaena sp. FACHB-1998 TaxID=2692858 RepID=UPI001680A29B|nr:hypothetical protein [Pseudanabaena sp. FACHB-1998]